MSRYLAIGALSLAVLCMGVAGFLLWRNGQLREDLGAAERALAVAERQLEDAAGAARVLDAHLNRMEDERRGLNATLRDLRSKEGYDAPLSDFLRDAYDRM